MRGRPTSNLLRWGRDRPSSWYGQGDLGSDSIRGLKDVPGGTLRVLDGWDEYPVAWPVDQKLSFTFLVDNEIIQILLYSGS